MSLNTFVRYLKVMVTLINRLRGSSSISKKIKQMMTYPKLSHFHTSKALLIKWPKYLIRRKLEFPSLLSTPYEKFLTMLKTSIDLKKAKGVYLVPCDYGKVYINETGKTFQIRFKEHDADISHGCINKSALAKHSNDSKHQIFLEKSNIIAKIDHYTKRKIREAMEIEKHPANLNKDDGWRLRKSWCLVIDHIKKKVSLTINSI
jgi:hypothetical protein